MLGVMSEEETPIRVKFTEVRTVEFDLNPENYPTDDGSPPLLDDMLAFEAQAAEEMFEFWEGAETESITYRVLSGGDLEHSDSTRRIDRGMVTQLSVNFQSDLLDFAAAAAQLVEEHGTPELKAQLERIIYGGI